MHRRLRWNLVLWAVTLGLSLGYAIDKGCTEKKMPWEQAISIVGMIGALISEPPDKKASKKSETLTSLEKDEE